jgi:hypothetical protein
MTTLVIHGNTNPFTFANSIVAASLKAIELFHKPLSDIHVIHSIASEKVLRQDSALSA